MSVVVQKGKTPLSRFRPRSKYHAIPTVVDGHRFDSKAEARRWNVLRMMERGGLISNLERQVPYPLEVLGVRLGEYRADFRYVSRGQVFCEDVKGMDTPLSRWKRKHVAAQYGIEVGLVK